jgi:two-component system, NarL family, response regulator FusR
MRTSSGDPHGTVRILIVDDHPIMRRGLVELVNDAPGLTVCAEAGTIADALTAAAAAQPHVAVVDLSLGVESGLDLVTALAERHPTMHTLVLSGHDEALYADRALKAGALGYITKDQPPAELITAVRRVASGKPYASAETTERILSSLGSRRRVSDARPAIDRLSDRERHVLTLLGKGLSTRDIAGHLELSVKTIESHYAHMKEKLGAASGRELMRLAVAWSDDGPPLLPSKRPGSQ